MDSQEQDFEYVALKRDINTLTDAKQAIEELQVMTRSVFQKAAEEGWQTELANHAMGLQEYPESAEEN